MTKSAGEPGGELHGERRVESGQAAVQEHIDGEERAADRRDERDRPEHRPARLHDDQHADEAGRDRGPPPPADMLLVDDGGKDGQDERLDEEDRHRVGDRHDT